MAIDIQTDTTLKVLRSLQAGEVSSTEVFEAMLARIEAFNPDVNAVVAMDLERARAEAAAADDLFASGDKMGPLHGLPMTLKDSYETLELTTTSGSPAFAGHVPERDADVARLLRRAGAIVWAKTNVPYLTSDHQTYNDVYGLTRNPWDLDRTVGGSSGGAAAAIACGFTTAEVGSDIGGSIRQPASMCGVFGLKTTHGLISGRGHIPGDPGALALGDLGVFGPMGRSCGDLRLLVEVLTNSSTAFDGVPGAALERADAPVDISSLRIGVWADDPVAPVDASVKAVVEGMAASLDQEGAVVNHEVRPTVSSEELYSTYVRLLNAAWSTTLDEEAWWRLTERIDGGYGHTDDSRLAFARDSTLPHREWLRANEMRAQAQAAWDEVFELVDVVIAPVGPVPPFPHDIDRPYGQRTLTVNGAEVPYRSQLFWAGLATMPLLPALSLPVGSVDGLPVGVQIIGPKWSDHKLMAYGEEIASVLGVRFSSPYR